MKGYIRYYSQEDEKELFKQQRVRETQTRDLSIIRCTKDEDSKVLTDDTKLQERRQAIFRSTLMRRGLMFPTY